MILFHRTDSFNSAPGESELLWYLRTSPAAVKPELSSSEVKERRGGKRPNIRAGHHKTLFTRFSSNAFLSSLSSLFTLSFLSLLFSHVKLFLWLQYFKSICYFRKTHEIIVVCVCVGGQPAECLSVVASLGRRIQMSLLECGFLNLQCIFDRWYSWLPWLTLENELLLIKWNLMIYI